MNEYEVTLTVSRVKQEHVHWTVRALEALSRVLTLDGSDIGIDISVEKDRDGVERFAEFYTDVHGDPDSVEEERYGHHRQRH